MNKPITLEFHESLGAGNLRFTAADGSTTMLLCADGKIEIRGEKVDDNRRVYEAMCKLLGVSLDGPASQPPTPIFDPGPHARDHDLDWLTRNGGG